MATALFSAKGGGSKRCQEAEKKVVTDIRDIRPPVEIFKDRFKNTSGMFQGMFFPVSEKWSSCVRCLIAPYLQGKTSARNSEFGAHSFNYSFLKICSKVNPPTKEVIHS